MPAFSTQNCRYVTKAAKFQFRFSSARWPNCIFDQNECLSFVKIMIKTLYGLAIAMVALANVSIALAEDAASRLFADSRQLVYQVRVIDKGSGDKSSIGSGFLVSSDGQRLMSMNPGNTVSNISPTTAAAAHSHWPILT